MATGAESRGSTCSLVAFATTSWEALHVILVKYLDGLIARPAQPKDHAFGLGVVRHRDSEAEVLGEAGNRADRYGPAT